MTGTRSSFVLVVILASHAVSLAHFDTALAQVEERPSGDVTLRQRAEDLARAASERFSQILSGEEGAKTANGPPSEAEPLDPIWDWLGQASRAYRGVIITKLKNPAGEVAILVPPGGAAPALPSTPAAADAEVNEPPARLSWTYLVESVREWLARANRSYRNEIVKELVVPQPSAPTQTVAPDAAAPAESAPAPQSKPEPAPARIAAGPEPTSQAAGATQKAEPKAQAKDETQAEAKRKAEAEAKAKREAEAEAKRKAEADTKAKREAEAEAKRKAEADTKAKREAEAEAKRKAEAEAKAQREAEAEARRSAEAQAKRLAEEEAAEEKAVAEAKRMPPAEPPAPDAMADRQPVPTPPERKSANGGEAAAKPRGETLVAERPAPEVQSTRKHASKGRHAKARHAKAHHVKNKRVRRRSASVRRPRMHAHAHVYEARHERTAWRGRKRQRCAKVHRHRRAEVRGWSSGRVHVVRRGETLSRISQRYYGSAGAYRSIYRANRHKLRSPHLIYPRQRLYIP